MSSAARSFGPKGGGNYVTRARAAWGDSMPATIRQLALACDLADNLGVVAVKLNYSVGAISSVLANTYKGRLDRIEASIEGVLMQGEVYCPAAGMTIARNVCADHQKQKTASSANPLAARFPAACRGCTHSFGGTNA